MRKSNVRGCMLSGTDGVAGVARLDSVGTNTDIFISGCECRNAFGRLQIGVSEGKTGVAGGICSPWVKNGRAPSATTTREENMAVASEANVVCVERRVWNMRKYSASGF